jgi:hypothetical protein
LRTVPAYAAGIKCSGRAGEARMATPLVKSSAGVGTGPGLQAAVSKMSLRSSGILFVDDDEAFSYAAAKELRAAGYEVWLAPDHRLALQIPESPQFADRDPTDGTESRSRRSRSANISTANSSPAAIWSSASSMSGVPPSRLPEVRWGQLCPSKLRESVRRQPAVEIAVCGTRHGHQSLSPVADRRPWRTSRWG